MTTRNDTGPRAHFLPVLAGLIVLCLGAAAALTLLTHNTAPVSLPAELSLVVQRVPYEAQNALRGESSAFDALAKSTARLKTLRAALPDGGAGKENWNKLGEGLKTVSAARTAG